MSTILRYLPVMIKAIVAGVGSATAEYALALQDGVTWGEWGFIAGTVAAIMYGTWRAENRPVEAPTSGTQVPG